MGSNGVFCASFYFWCFEGFLTVGDFGNFVGVFCGYLFERNFLSWVWVYFVECMLAFFVAANAVLLYLD